MGDEKEEKEDTGISARCLPEGRKCAVSANGINCLFYLNHERIIKQELRSARTIQESHRPRPSNLCNDFFRECQNIASQWKISAQVDMGFSELCDGLEDAGGGFVDAAAGFVEMGQIDGGSE